MYCTDFALKARFGLIIILLFGKRDKEKCAMKEVNNNISSIESDKTQHKTVKKHVYKPRLRQTTYVCAHD